MANFVEFINNDIDRVKTVASTVKANFEAFLDAAEKCSETMPNTLILQNTSRGNSSNPAVPAQVPSLIAVSSTTTTGRPGQVASTTTSASPTTTRTAPTTRLTTVVVRRSG